MIKVKYPSFIQNAYRKISLDKGHEDLRVKQQSLELDSVEEQGQAKIHYPISAQLIHLQCHQINSLHITSRKTGLP